MRSKTPPPPVAAPIVDPGHKERSYEVLDSQITALQQVTHNLMHLYEMSFFIELDDEKATLERLKAKLEKRAHGLAKGILKWRV